MAKGTFPKFITALIREVEDYATGLANPIAPQVADEMRQFFSDTNFTSVSSTNLAGITADFLAKSPEDAAVFIRTTRSLTDMHQWKINGIESCLYDKYEAQLAERMQHRGVTRPPDLPKLELNQFQDTFLVLIGEKSGSKRTTTLRYYYKLSKLRREGVYFILAFRSTSWRKSLEGYMESEEHVRELIAFEEMLSPICKRIIVNIAARQRIDFSKRASITLYSDDDRTPLPDAEQLYPLQLRNAYSDITSRPFQSTSLQRSLELSDLHRLLVSTTCQLKHYSPSGRSVYQRSTKKAASLLWILKMAIGTMFVLLQLKTLIMEHSLAYFLLQFI